MTQPALATTTSAGRVYRVGGLLYPSITTVINAGVPRPFLVPWAAKQAALYVEDNFEELVADRQAPVLPKPKRVAKIRDAYKRYTAARGRRGDEVHAWCEWFARVSMGLTIDNCWECDGTGLVEDDDEQVARCGCREPHVSEDAKAAKESAALFMSEWRPEFVHVERTVVNRSVGYAGTFDFLAYLDIAGVGRVLTAGDFKTSSGVYAEVGLQLAAIRHAETMLIPQADGSCVEEPMPAVDMCVEVHLADDGYEVLPIAAGEEQFRAFRAALAVRHFAEVVSHRTIGTPVYPAH